jgi:hypothetical protein
VRDPVRERVADVDRARDVVGAADADVPPDVDGIGGMAGELLGGEVGGQALGTAADVDADARGQADRVP